MNKTTQVLFFFLWMSVSAFVNAAGVTERQIDTHDDIDLASLRQQVAQKLFIDLRYYCEPEATGHCQQAVVSLPDKLSSMLTTSQVGGVILFSENLQSAEQILALNASLQQAALSLRGASSQELSLQGIPLYIGIDQEGGRVSRLPQHEFLGFAGNMAIGATMQMDKAGALNISDTSKTNTQFAAKTGRAIAQQLSHLGFNVNFAPVLDVNSNPDNPIINVRSYGEQASLVGDAGADAIQAMQSVGIAAAAKHFPGHGDTHVDSHVGLPSVNHAIDDIYKVDLAPFIQVIANPNTQPDMIMTAHIQYPALDSTEFVSRSGDKTILPATLSKKILTGLLREELGYTGLIITDSLEMAAITQFLSPQQAVIKAFKAGADITLMPFKISSSQDADAFVEWLDGLTLAISKDPQLVKQVSDSYHAILAHKKKLGLLSKAPRSVTRDYSLELHADKRADFNKGLNAKLKHADSYNNANDILLAMQFSRASFTQIKPRTVGSSNAEPKYANRKALIKALDANIVAVMPDKLRCDALLHYANKANVNNLACISTLSQVIPTRLGAVDLFIVGDASPSLAFHESRATEGITAQQRLDANLQGLALNKLIVTLPASTKKVLIKLRAPYINLQDVSTFDAIYASYDYQVVKYPDGDLMSPAFDTFMQALLGQYQPLGRLPVSLSEEVQNAL